jgi:hypothetical protein
VILPGDRLSVTIEKDPNLPMGGGPLHYTPQVRPEGTIPWLLDSEMLIQVQGLSPKGAADRIVKEARESGAGDVVFAAVRFVGEHIAEAQGTIHVIADPRLASLDLETARALSDTSAYADALAAKAGLDPNQCRIEGVPVLYSGSDVAGRAGPSISVSVAAHVRGGTQKEARVLVEAACEKIFSAFDKWGQKGSEPMRLRYVAALVRAKDLAAELNKARESMVASLRGYASLAEYAKAVQSLQVDKDTLLLSVEIAEFRKRLLGEKIESLRKQMADAAKGDAISAELEKVVGFREQAIKRVEEMIRQSAAAPSELGEAQEKLALAKAELLRRREEVARSSGGEQLAQLTHQLTEAELAAAEAALRCKAIEKRLAEMSAMDEVAQLEVHQAHLQARERELLEQEKEVLELRRLAEAKPIVVVRVSFPEPAPPKEPPATSPAK